MVLHLHLFPTPYIWLSPKQILKKCLLWRVARELDCSEDILAWCSSGWGTVPFWLPSICSHILPDGVDRGQANLKDLPDCQEVSIRLWDNIQTFVSYLVKSSITPKPREHWERTWFWKHRDGKGVSRDPDDQRYRLWSSECSYCLVQ